MSVVALFREEVRNGERLAGEQRLTPLPEKEKPPRPGAGGGFLKRAASEFLRIQFVVSFCKVYFHFMDNSQVTFKIFSEARHVLKGFYCKKKRQVVVS